MYEFALISAGYGAGFMTVLFIAMFQSRSEATEKLREKADLEAKSKNNQKKPV
jgi:hypothetical protein